MMRRMPLAVDVVIACRAWQRAVPRIERACRGAVRAAVTAARWRRRSAATVALMSDRRVRALNAAFRGIDKPTNVLAFPARDAGRSGVVFIGDIAIALETARREARAEGKPLGDHLTHLVVHGLLHLFGHDHDTGAAAERMEDMERAALGSLGLPDPYGRGGRRDE
jgi:probable rRNA maturation factor